MSWLGCSPTSASIPASCPTTLEGRRDLWLDRVTGKRVLLILDDARDHAQVEPLLPVGGSCLTLITSRRRLAALDGAVPLPLDVLDPGAAAELLITLAYRTTAEAGADRAAVAEIVRLCGFLPLAIVLLAGRLVHHPAWTITRLADEFAAAQDRLSELEAGPRAVRAAFTMSYQDLPPERQRLFRCLGLHPGPDIDMHAAAALAGVPVPVARTELEALYTDHLIEETQPGRYRLHDLLGEYARTLAGLDPPDTNSRAVDRLLNYYQVTAIAADRHLARRARPAVSQAGGVREFGDEVQALAWMRAEYVNLLACLDHITRHQPRRAIDLTDALARLLELTGPWPQAARLHLRALAAARDLADRLGEAHALNNLGIVRGLIGDYAEAADLYRQALALFREIGDRFSVARALNNLGNVRQSSGDYADAADLYRDALALDREIGDRFGEANALFNLGRVCGSTGNYADATDLYGRALIGYRDIGSRLGEARTLNSLGVVRMRVGDHADAADLHRQALVLFREIGDRHGEASAAGCLGMVRHSTGDYADAADLYRDAVAVDREIGDRLGEATYLTNLGALHETVGDYAEAAALHRQALALFREIGNRHGEAHALSGIGTIHENVGDHAEAADLHRQALAVLREIGDRVGETEVLNKVGTLLLQMGKPRTALERFTEALALARMIHSQLEQARALEGASRCRVRLGDTAPAVTGLHAAVEIYRRLGVPEADAAATYLAALEPRSQSGCVG